MKNSLREVEKSYSVIVIGGGFAGMCAAISSARSGAKTALIHNRPVLGGNGSAEIHVALGGASCMGRRKNAREGGIIDEIQLQNRYMNSNNSEAIFDMILWGKCVFQEKLDLYLNTAVTDVCTENNKIVSVDAFGIVNETKYHFQSDIFIDCTGDGTVAYLAGAEYMTGREGAADFGELGTVSEADHMTMGNSLLYRWEDTGYPVRYVKPDWAYDFGDKELGNIVADNVCPWWVELGGTKLDIIKDYNEIETELKKIVAGVWDYIKNSGKFESDNYDLKWIGGLAGKRESRRFIGDYILNENDLVNGSEFKDAVAYGGWHIDSHEPEKFYHKMRELDGLPDECEKDRSAPVPEVYQIPYRCLYSKNIDNLMFAGRNISVTHRALASTRLMLTCAVLGQAAGTAAAMAVKNGLSPRQTGEQLIVDIQQQLLKDDCYIPHISNQDEQDYARMATVSCSSQAEGYECTNVINGVSRTVGDESNLWRSRGLDEREWILLKLADIHKVGQLRIYFNPDYSLEIYPTQQKWHLENIVTTQIPETLVKDFNIIFLKNGTEIYREEVKDNYQRMVVRDLEYVTCDEIKIEVLSTHGSKSAEIFEIRVY